MPCKQKEQPRDPGPGRRLDDRAANVKLGKVLVLKVGKSNMKSAVLGQLPGVSVCNCLDMKQGGDEK